MKKRLYVLLILFTGACSDLTDLTDSLPPRLGPTFDMEIISTSQNSVTIGVTAPVSLEVYGLVFPFGTELNDSELSNALQNSGAKINLEKDQTEELEIALTSFHLENMKKYTVYAMFIQHLPGQDSPEEELTEIVSKEFTYETEISEETSTPTEEETPRVVHPVFVDFSDAASASPAVTVDLSVHQVAAGLNVPRSDLPSLTVHLPVRVLDASPRHERLQNTFAGGVRPLAKINAGVLASSPGDIKYMIISGNPEYSIIKEQSSGALTEFHLKGYRIDSQGYLYPKDVWLLGRNTNEYHHPDEQEMMAKFESNGKFYHLDDCVRLPNQDGLFIHDCTDVHNYFFDYTFGRTDVDHLIVEVENQSTGEKGRVYIKVKPNPVSIELEEACENDDPLEEWACVHTQALLPAPDEPIVTTQVHSGSLPTGLRKNASEYELVVSAEFDSIEETRKYFYPFRRSDLVEVRDGKLILVHNRVQNGRIDGQPACKYHRPAEIRSKGLFEPSMGYFEIKFARYPTAFAAGGNIIMWSRYGIGHSGFAFTSPERFFLNDTIVRSELNKIGFLEVDFLEKWSTWQTRPYFNVFLYPSRGRRDVPPPQLYGKLVDVGTRTNITNGGWNGGGRYGEEEDFYTGEHIGSFSTVYGVEIAPGQTPLIFQDGVPNSINSSLSLRGVPLWIKITGIRVNSARCSLMPETNNIEVEYIRLYRPRNGY